MNFKKAIQRGLRNAIVDITYTLYPDLSFIQEVKKANARSKKIAEFSAKQKAGLLTHYRTL